MQQTVKSEFGGTGAKRNRFPRGEAVERSETDEERRYEPISYSVRKKVLL